jgi:hypothetical protein
MNTMDLALQPLAQGTAAGSGDVAAKRGRGAAFVRGSKLVVLTVVLGALVLVGCGKSTATSAGSSAGVTSSVPAAGAAGGAGTSAAAATTSAGGCPTSNTKSFAKSKFVLHVGLAAGTFHRYLYKPFKAGTFHKGASGRISGLVKGGATALFDEHEIRQAITDVKANPTLCKVLIAPLSEVADKFTAMKSKLTSGDTTSLDTVNSSLSSISSTSAKDGAPITERTDQSAG